jgi:hypothetical protein
VEKRALERDQNQFESDLRKKLLRDSSASILIHIDLEKTALERQLSINLNSE